MNNQSTKSVANPGQGPAPPPYFWTKPEAQRAKKKFFSRLPPLLPGPLSRGLDDRTPPLSEGLDEYSNMINVREMFRSSLYVTKQKAYRNGRGKE